MNTRSLLRHGIMPSCVQLPIGSWPTVLDFLCEQFGNISREQWVSRVQRALVLDEQYAPVALQAPYIPGKRIFYYREVANEEPIPFAESVLYADSHILIADKPHFLPVSPVGEYVQETLLTRLKLRLDNEDIVPLHRIDRATAGLVMFSLQPASRDAYQALFRNRQIKKRYIAIAPPITSVTLPHVRASRIVRGEPFVLSTEVSGVPNTETRIEVEACGEKYWRYALYPVTGKKHQLRVHMAALGAPIVNDDFYPTLQSREPGDFLKPLQLLAKELEFVDPLSGEQRKFVSELKLTVQ